MPRDFSSGQESPRRAISLLDRLDELEARIAALEQRGERRRRQRADARIEREAGWVREVDAAVRIGQRAAERPCEFRAPGEAA